MAQKQVKTNEGLYIDNYVENELQSSSKDGTIDNVAEKKYQFRKEAKRLVEVNKMEVVVFFDEANTTEAVGLIKEVMCDRRILGKPICEELKFIAACNPYRRCGHVVALII